MHIVTNNPKILSAYPGVKWVAGGPLEVLGECRKMVHEGYSLFTHPLMGDIHLMVNPFRTVILGEKREEIDLHSLEWIEGSMEKLRLVRREPRGSKDLEDYQIIDFDLFQTSTQSEGFDGK